jgi:type 1 glutamine amidotransferase
MERQMRLILAIVTLVASVAGRCFSAAPVADAPAPIRVVLITGQNNHDWPHTTPVLKKILEDSGRFTVDVNLHPEAFAADTLAKCDVVLSNWNTFGNEPNKVTQWPAATQEAFLNFIRAGHGFVVVHAGGASFPDWADYQKLIGGTWGKGTGHGAVHKFKVHITDTKSPITEGMADFETTDELWHRMVVQPDRQILATALSDITGQPEQDVLTTHFGNGRCFNLALGHNVGAMQSAGFQTLLLRGTEWAATGKVTIPVPPGIAVPAAPAATPLHWERTDGSLTLLHDQQVIWQLHFNKEEGKPYFHPLGLGDGTTLTALRPADHPWHRGLWWSWKLINGINYWEEDRKTGQSQGQTELVNVTTAPNPDGSAAITMQLAYHPPGAAPVLTESRSITVSAPAPNGSYSIDWAATFTATDKDVVLDRTPPPASPGGKGWGGYAGLSLRLAADLKEAVFLNSQNATDLAQLHGQPARWLDFSGQTANGKSIGVALFDHPSNPHHPNLWFVIPTMPFMSPALLFHEPYTLPAGKSLAVRYRIWVHTGKATPEELDKQWKLASN